MLSTWQETRRVFVALLIFSLAALATACDSVTGPETRLMEFSDRVVVDEGWTDVTNPAPAPRPIRKEFAK